MPTEYAKMIAGDFYKPSDPELRALAASSRENNGPSMLNLIASRGQRLSNHWLGSTGGKCCHESSVRYGLRC